MLQTALMGLITASSRALRAAWIGLPVVEQVTRAWRARARRRRRPAGWSTAGGVGMTNRLLPLPPPQDRTRNGRADNRHHRPLPGLLICPFAWSLGPWLRCRRFGVYFAVAVVVAAFVVAGGFLVCWLLLAHAGGVWAAFGFNAALTQL